MVKSHTCGKCANITEWDKDGEAVCPVLAAFTLPSDMSPVRSKRQRACGHFRPKDADKTQKEEQNG